MTAPFFWVLEHPGNLPLTFWVFIFTDDLTADISVERVSAAPVTSATGFHAHVAPYWNDAVHLARCT